MNLFNNYTAQKLQLHCNLSMSFLGEQIREAYGWEEKLVFETSYRAGSLLHFPPQSKLTQAELRPAETPVDSNIASQQMTKTERHV